MGVTVLTACEVPATTTPEVWIDDSGGYRQVFVRGQVVATEDQDTCARATRFALDAGDIHGKTVAWLGGGLCIGPRLFALMGAKQTVYEIEPALGEFCPEGVEFIPGDWQTTISGRYDVIVYDLGGDVPRETLSKYLNPGGIILS